MKCKKKMVTMEKPPPVQDHGLQETRPWRAKVRPMVIVENASQVKWQRAEGKESAF